MPEMAVSNPPDLLVHQSLMLQLLTVNPRDSNIVPRAGMAVVVPSRGRALAVLQGPSHPVGHV